VPAKIDIIILSYAKDDNLKALTTQTVKTLFESESPNEVEFNVLVIESNKALQPYQFANTTTIYPSEEFGFNRYLNIGIKHTRNPYICLCNNDLIFHKGWATEILKAMGANPAILSANPYSGDEFYNDRIVQKKNVILRSKNLKLNGVLTGWCIFVNRVIFEKIGLLDEQFEFWYADNDYDLTLKKNKIEHALVKKSIVKHIAMQSHDTLPDKEKMTQGQRNKFENKWRNNSFSKKTIALLKDKIKQILSKTA